MPLVICLLLKVRPWFYNRHYDSHLRQVVKQMQPRQALTQHSSCGPTSPGTLHEKVNTLPRHVCS